MPLSKMSYDELKAQAMLIGATYDPIDHTFMTDVSEMIICADTFRMWALDDFLSGGNISEHATRKVKVERGLIGVPEGRYVYNENGQGYRLRTPEDDRNEQDAEADN